MATLANDFTGHIERRPHIVDLDAGTGVPRIVAAAGILLAIAVLVILLTATRPAPSSESPVIERHAVQSSLAIPALRPLAGPVQPRFDPVRLIGATSFIVDPIRSLPQYPLIAMDTKN